MSAVFLKLLNMSITASWVIMAVIVLRFLLYRAPKWLRCVLWAIVAVRLVCPFSLESTFSLIPSAEMIPSAAVQYIETPSADTGVSIMGDNLNDTLDVPGRKCRGFRT